MKNIDASVDVSESPENPIFIAFDPNALAPLTASGEEYCLPQFIWGSVSEILEEAMSGPVTCARLALVNVSLLLVRLQLQSARGPSFLASMTEWAETTSAPVQLS